ncbi:acylneuraminate cytidylyltransferase family protein [Geomonas terrae]|uniref:Acylneuraminate cytidylyltransferase family protein n=1 Tax=Geomonas terrae TaxID=2562681 RepID=A0A4S1CBS1_9BACT|nr:acylneuraminate cytidylyltransferase family protein [Geomonas terrae]TGU70583.1 acylneuraminate cytidylyltransferase family protein [Geomonas terrae]
MIAGKKVLAVIPARGGSKEVPRKNIRDLGGKPLLAWTIEAAQGAKYIDRLVLSSEDPEIIDVARKWGCEVPFVRPAVLSGDEIHAVDPALHAVSTLPGYDYLVLLQPTSPLRRSADIDGCIELCQQLNARSCVTVTKPDKHPFLMYTLDSAGVMHPLLNRNVTARRQDLPVVYALNGSIYVCETTHLVATRSFVDEHSVAYVMDKQFSVDIDSELDFTLADALIQQQFFREATVP